MVVAAARNPRRRRLPCRPRFSCTPWALTPSTKIQEKKEECRQKQKKKQEKKVRCQSLVHHSLAVSRIAVWRTRAALWGCRRRPSRQESHPFVVSMALRGVACGGRQTPVVRFGHTRSMLRKANKRGTKSNARNAKAPAVYCGVWRLYSAWAADGALRRVGAVGAPAKRRSRFVPARRGAGPTSVIGAACAGPRRRGFLRRWILRQGRGQGCGCCGCCGGGFLRGCGGCGWPVVALLLTAALVTTITGSRSPTSPRRCSARTELVARRRHEVLLPARIAQLHNNHN